MVTLPESCLVRLALHGLGQPESRLTPFCNIVDLDFIFRGWVPPNPIYGCNSSTGPSCPFMPKSLSSGVAVLA